jgi:hypothetical protein
LLADYEPRHLLTVTTSDILRYDIGLPIKFPNYALLRSPGGTVYLLVDDVRRGIASREIFRRLGFNPDEVVDASWADLLLYEEGAPIASADAAPLGELWQDRTSGGVFYVVDGRRHPVPSREVLRSRFARYPIRPATPAALAALPLGEAVRFRDGELIATPGDATVFVVSHGKRRPIVSADVFRALGYQWQNVVTTSPHALEAHPLGEAVTG